MTRGTLRRVATRGSYGGHGTEPGPQRLAALWSETQMATPPAQKVGIRGGTGGFGIHIEGRL